MLGYQTTSVFPKFSGGEWRVVLPRSRAASRNRTVSWMASGTPHLQELDYALPRGRSGFGIRLGQLTHAASGSISLIAPRPLDNTSLLNDAFRALLAPLRHREWVVYAKAAIRRTQQVIEYLG